MRLATEAYFLRCASGGLVYPGGRKRTGGSALEKGRLSSFEGPQFCTPCHAKAAKEVPKSPHYFQAWESKPERVNLKEPGCSGARIQKLIKGYETFFPLA